MTSAGIGFADERSTLADAVALLLVGVPVWWHYWSKVRDDRAVEVETMVRYVTLLGSGGRDLAEAVRRRTGVPSCGSSSGRTWMWASLRTRWWRPSHRPSTSSC